MADIKRNLDNLNKLLNNMEEQQASTPSPRISEGEFRSQWLPIFWYYGQIDPSTGEPVKVNLLAWIINVAGSIYNEVDVIDSDGSVLFTVPPVSPYRKPAIGMLEYTVGGSREVMPTATILANAANSFNRKVNLVQADRDMNSVANLYMGDHSQELNLVDYYRRWDAIFDRYVKDRKRWSTKSTVINNEPPAVEEEDEPLF